MLSSCLILLELTRFLLLGGFPWLLPGLVFLDTFGEILIPKFSGSRIKLEYDGTDYDLEGYEPVPQESRFNY